MSMTDRVATPPEQAFAEQVKAAGSAGTSIAIQGGGTKAFYGHPVEADARLDCSIHRGLVAYEPTELAITVRAGTPLSEVEALLAEQGQEFPFEPPHFGEHATIGGMVAAGLSGPRRPYAASVRDAVLGVRMLNGQGEVLSFGGRVMKNVAGYDLSRLMVGALGELGVLLEVSLKVLPRPSGQVTLVQEQDLAGALALMQHWAARALPITGTAWLDGRLHVRLAGSDEALVEAQRILGGTPLNAAEADAFWLATREQRLACFGGEQPLWRVSLPPATAADVVPEPALVEWGGALRWLRTEPGHPDGAQGAKGADGAGAGEVSRERFTGLAARLRARAAAAGGHVTLFRAGADGLIPDDGVFAPLSPVVRRLHRNLKRAFDPAGVFNPGRLYR